MTGDRGVRAVAAIELAKGVLVMAGGFGLLAAAPAAVERALEALLREFHLNPAHETRHVFLSALPGLASAHHLALAAGALGYAALRLAEGLGLWFGRAWAAWIGVVSAALYLPIELLELARGLTWPRAALLASNLLVVAVLARRLRANADAAG